MTTAEKQKAWKKRTLGRERGPNETMVLELLCERGTITLHDAADFLRGSPSLAHSTLGRLADQKLAVMIERGYNSPIHPKPSIWQLRETYEREKRPIP